MISPIEKELIRLFENRTSTKCTEIVRLPPSGSYREYYRIKNESQSFIGVYNEDKKENIAFLSFSKHFRNSGLHVPEIYSENIDNNVYIQQDLGDETLFSFLSRKRQNDVFSNEIIAEYKKVISEMPKFQITAGKTLDYSVCYPRHSFDKQSMRWDLNYFKYYLLKLAKIPFDEQNLENDFNKFADFLLQAESDYFLYRDFQSRNIMLYQNTPYFIDYQGGRKGSLYYDIASLLYDAKAAIPQSVRNELLDFYLQILGKFIKVNEKEFFSYYNGNVLIRMMQAMGTYGFRGIYEQKAHFLQSIPYALSNLRNYLDTVQLSVELPELWKVLNLVAGSEFLKNVFKPNSLTVNIASFSYKKGYPEDKTKNGGGFVFDCRALPNPGRFEQYKHFTGKDKPVIDFLQNTNEVNEFIHDIFSLVEKSIKNYQSRNFTDLMISFGCTGGQHRSVFCAEKFAEMLKKKYNINVYIYHRELQASGIK